MRPPSDNKNLIELAELTARGIVIVLLIILAGLLTTAIAKADGSKQFVDDYVQQMAPCQPDARPYYIERNYPKGVIDYPERHYKRKFATVPTPSVLGYLIFVLLFMVGIGLITYAYTGMYKRAKIELGRIWAKRKYYRY